MNAHYKGTIYSKYEWCYDYLLPSNNTYSRIKTRGAGRQAVVNFRQEKEIQTFVQLYVLLC